MSSDLFTELVLSSFRLMPTIYKAMPKEIQYMAVIFFIAVLVISLAFIQHEKTKKNEYFGTETNVSIIYYL